VSVLCVVGDVQGVTQLHDVVYIVCYSSSTISRFNATTHQRLTDIVVKDLIWPWDWDISRFNATIRQRLTDIVVKDLIWPWDWDISRFNATTHQRMTGIVVRDLRDPHDIVACEQTSQIYVADSWECIWRVSSDGADIQRWLPKSASDRLMPYTLSVTSTRLLVTSYHTCRLTQFDAVGNELRRVQLWRNIEPSHAVESPTGTFIVSYHGMVGEVNTGGGVLRQFSSSHLSPAIGAPHVAVDSHGNILVADKDNSCILLLDAQLTLRRVIVDKHQSYYKSPRRLCYKEQSGQLLVGLVGGEVAVFDVLRR